MLTSRSRRSSSNWRDRSVTARLTSCTVIENGIDLDRFGGAGGERAAARAALGIPQDAWVVGTVGRLAIEKDFPLLVRAAAPLLGEGGHLVIVGEGDQREAISDEIASTARRIVRSPHRRAR